MGKCSGNVQRALRIGGFTLLELMVTLAVAAILLVVAVPSYRGVVQRNSVAANVNDLVGDLNYARSEAVGRGATIYICASSNQADCRNDDKWSDGWVIYAPSPTANSSAPDDDNRLRVHGATGSGFTLTANKSALSFNADGFAISGATFTAQAQNSAKASDTIVKVASTGRVDSHRGSAQ